MTEDFRTFYADPGEDFGWCIGRGTKLLARGTEKMWPTAHLVEDALIDPTELSNPLNNADYTYPDTDPADMILPIKRIVCEDFRIYPWLVKELAFDQVRTARVIGALTYLAQRYRIPLHLQGANIKSAAVAAGAEELYDRPLRENRHQNDAIQHFVFFTNVELLGIKLPVPDSVTKEDFS